LLFQLCYPLKTQQFLKDNGQEHAAAQSNQGFAKNKTVESNLKYWAIIIHEPSISANRYWIGIRRERRRNSGRSGRPPSKGGL
jgi:hypothetical protein